MKAETKKMIVLAIALPSVAFVGWLAWDKLIKPRLKKKGDKKDEPDANRIPAPSDWTELSKGKQKDLVDKTRELTEISTAIYKAIFEHYKGLAEDEEAVIKAVKKFKTKAEFSYAYDLYNTQYKKDMWADIKNALYGKLDTSDKDLIQVTDHIKSIPQS